MVAFDMDGVIVDHASSWAWIHEHFGVDNSETLEAFMRGEVDDREFMRRDIALWKGLQPELRNRDLLDIFEDIPLIQGIAETVEALRSEDILSVIISGGIDVLAQRVTEDFGFDGYAANGLEELNGRLTGEGVLNVLLVDKEIALRRQMSLYGASTETVASVGNSFIDVSMFQASSLSIAFNPIDDLVIQGADVVIRSNDLRDVLPHLFQI